MTEPQPPASQPSFTPAPAPGIFGSKTPSAVTFAVGIMLFFLPFLEITCNSMTIQAVSGLQLATGFNVKSDPGEFYVSDIVTKSETKTEKTPEREKPNIYAAMALVFGLIGFILSMMNLKTGGTGGLIMGLLSSMSLIGLMIDVGNRVKLNMASKGEDLQISIGMTPWFYICIIVFLAAAFFSYKRLKAKGT
jgi:hypothetical protein